MNISYSSYDDICSNESMYMPALSVKDLSILTVFNQQTDMICILSMLIINRFFV